MLIRCRLWRWSLSGCNLFQHDSSVLASRVHSGKFTNYDTWEHGPRNHVFIRRVLDVEWNERGKSTRWRCVSLSTSTQCAENYTARPGVVQYLVLKSLCEVRIGKNCKYFLNYGFLENSKKFFKCSNQSFYLGVHWKLVNPKQYATQNTKCFLKLQDTFSKPLESSIYKAV